MDLAHMKADHKDMVSQSSVAVAGNDSRQRSLFESLPNEIIDAIFSLLPRDRHLLQVALTCQRFRVLVEPYKYHTIQLYLYGRNRSLDYCNYSRFTGLISTLQKRPDLRVLVSRLSIDVHRSSDDFKSYNALLALLPSLSSLQLCPPTYNLNMSLLFSLQHLDLVFWDITVQRLSNKFQNQFLVDFRSSMNVFSRVLDLPCLRTLSVSGLNISGPFSGLQTAKHRTSPITTLRILQCSYSRDMGALPQVLRSIAALKNFTIDISGKWASELGLAISEHAGTLTELKILCTNSSYHQRPRLIGSLAAYPCLRHLAIPATFLYTLADSSFHEYLPPSLEILQLQCPIRVEILYSHELPIKTPRLERLAEYRELFLPNLKRVIWWQLYRSLAEEEILGERNLDKLSRLFEEKGMHFECSKAPLWDQTPLGKADNRTIQRLQQRRDQRTC